MRKLAAFILGCMLAVALVDIAFGAFCDRYIKKRTLPGDYENVDYLIRRCSDDVVILGSSVALNSLVPTVIEDSLGVTCFNGGANGQTLPFFESMVECLLTRYRPKMIIFGFTPDQLAGTGTGGRYNFLVPYYHRGFKTIDRYLESKDRAEPLLLKSNLYRYNTIWWRIFLYHFITAGEAGEKGFVAKGIPSVFPTLYGKEVEADVTEERMEEFARMVGRCRENGVEVAVYFPPQYWVFDGTPSTIRFVEGFCGENGIPCFNDSQDGYFLDRRELFYDNVHLNRDGAPVYTRMFVGRLKALFCPEWENRP